MDPRLFTTMKPEELDPTIDYPFGEDYILCESKGGGANRPGKFGGVYKYIPKGRKSLFKQDQVLGNNSDIDKPRMGKVLGEALVGSILRALYPKMVVTDKGIPLNDARLKEAKTNIAKVRLVRAAVKESDKSIDYPDNDLYIQSIFIKDYKNDLWVHAYRHHFKNEFEQKRLAVANDAAKQQAFADSLDKFIQKRCSSLIKKIDDLNKRLGKVDPNNKKLKFKLTTQLADTKKELGRINEGLIEQYPKEKIVNILQNNTEPAKTKLFNLIAKMKTDVMKRPSAAFKKKPSTVVSKYLMDHPSVMKEFCEQTALRLLLGDRGVHNANFGIRTDVSGNLHCCSLDYGTGFFDLSCDFDLYDLSKTGLPFYEMYKHHFREYPGVIYSKEMAIGLIKAGSLDSVDVAAAIKNAIQGLRDANLNIVSIRKMCARAGMKGREFSKETRPDVLLQKLEDFATTQITKRQIAFKHRGYSLLLENCMKNGEVDQKALIRNLKDYPELFKFAVSDFKTMHLAKSSGIETLVPTVRNTIADFKTKNKIIQSVIAQRPIPERLEEFTKLIRFYKGRSHQAAYAVDAVGELEMLKGACNELAGHLQDMKDYIKGSTEKLDEAVESLKVVQKFISDNSTGLTQANGVAFYGVEAKVFEGPGQEDLIQAKIREYVTSGGATQQIGMDQESDAIKSNKITNPVFTRVIHNKLEDGQKTYDVASVQRKLEDGSFKQEIHMGDFSQLNKMSSEAIRVMALLEVKNFLATTPDKKNGITMRGDWPKKLKRTIVAYCDLLRIEQEAAKAAALERGETFKEVNYNCYAYEGGKRKKLVANEGETKYLQGRLSQPGDRLASAIQQVVSEVQPTNQYRKKK